MSFTSLTFSELLESEVADQLVAIKAGKNLGSDLDTESEPNNVQAKTIISSKDRETILESLTTIMVSEKSNTKMFDKITLKELVRFFEYIESSYNDIKNDVHLLSESSIDLKTHFENSFGFLFDRVRFLEAIQYFAIGKIPIEKEIIFRSLVTKLIKTQETIRKSFTHESFADNYFDEFSDIKKIVLDFESPLIPPNLTEKAKSYRLMNIMINDLSKQFLDLLDSVEIPLHPKSVAPYEKQAYYEALVLMLRHSRDDLFDDLGLEEYPILVEKLIDILGSIYSHPTLFLYEHMKRQYLQNWLVYDLRHSDEYSEKKFYQIGKAKVYKGYKKAKFSDDFLEDLKNPDKLFDEDCLKTEKEVLNKLEDTDFYHLLQRVYKTYKADDLALEMPLSIHTQGGVGNVNLLANGMLQQVSTKQKQLQTTQSESSGVRGRRMTSLFNTIKKATTTFSSNFLKIEKAKSKFDSSPAQKKLQELKDMEPVKPKIMEIISQCKGTLLDTCFPTDKGVVVSLENNQNQDLAYTNSDEQALFSPLDKEALTYYWHDGEKDSKVMPENFAKFNALINAVLEVYANKVRTLHKKFVVGASITTIEEKVIYLKINGQIIIAVGKSKLGQSKKVADFKDKQTPYFRIFLSGKASRGSGNSEVKSILKAFTVDGKQVIFRDITVLYHLPKLKKIQAFLIEGLFNIIESLPEDKFADFNKGGKHAFIPVLSKFGALLNEEGIPFNRAFNEVDGAVEQEAK